MIDPAALRADSFDPFYVARRAALLAMVEHAMGKASVEADTAVLEDDEGDDDDDESA